MKTLQGKSYLNFKNGNRHSGLPSIHRGNNSSRSVQHHSYLDLMTQFSVNAEYPTKELTDIKKEQKHLKSLLHKINNQTLQLVQKINPNVKVKTHQRSTSVHNVTVKDLQLETSDGVLKRCEREIQLLQARSHLLTESGYDKESLSDKISKFQSEIELIRTENLHLTVSLNKTGSSIVVEEGNSAKTIQDLIQDLTVETKRVKKLREDNERTDREMFELQKKTEAIKTSFPNAQKFLKEHRSEQKEDQAAKERRQLSIIKANTIVVSKKKKEFIHTNLQFKYFSELKALEKMNAWSKDYEHNIDEATQRIEQQKDQISRLQSKLFKLKRRKIEQHREVNQFILKTKQEQNKSEIRQLQEQQIPEINNNAEDINKEGEIKADEIKADYIDLAKNSGNLGLSMPKQSNEKQPDNKQDGLKQQGSSQAAQ